MSHTPDQARALWCPMVRVGVLPQSGGPSAINDPTTVNYHGNCIAEKCAMWRWETMEVLPPNAEPNKLVACIKARAGTGYCGLAGRPEVAP